MICSWVTPERVIIERMKQICTVEKLNILDNTVFRKVGCVNRFNLSFCIQEFHLQVVSVAVCVFENPSLERSDLNKSTFNLFTTETVCI